MIRKDYLEKQLEQLAIALAKLVSELLKSKSEGSIKTGIEQANEFCKTEFDITLNEFNEVDSADIIHYLTEDKKLNTGKLNILADLLFATTQIIEKSEEEIKTKTIYTKLLLIYNYIDEKDKTFSASRQEKVTTIKSII
ncbi:MAG: hypothetical protein IPH89_15540 [Bacteroidetes bacterium]|nr:hypothetical protein [Bacteroidota bacterium]